MFTSIDDDRVSSQAMPTKVFGFWVAIHTLLALAGAQDRGGGGGGGQSRVINSWSTWSSWTDDLVSCAAGSTRTRTPILGLDEDEAERAKVAWIRHAHIAFR